MDPRKMDSLNWKSSFLASEEESQTQEREEIYILRQIANELIASKSPGELAYCVRRSYGDQQQGELGLFSDEQLPEIKSIKLRVILQDMGNWILKAIDPWKAAMEVGFVLDAPGIEGTTQTKIAQLTGFTKASVSRNVKLLCKKWGLPPSRGMKSLTACSVYRSRQRKVHGLRKEKLREGSLFQSVTNF